MDKFDQAHIRNVVLLSHSGAGKSSVAEAMLFGAKLITRLGTVEEGNTTSDYDPEEIRRKISINLSLLPFVSRDTKINIIDTPGYADFVGEVKAGIRAADGGVIVVCCTAGVEVGTEQVWHHADEEGLPRLIFASKVDRENANFFGVVEQIRTAFGNRCVPIQIPIGIQDKFEGVVDLVKMKAFRGDKPEDMPDSLRSEASSYREKLMEAIAETNDDLLTKYLEGEEITEEEIHQALRAGINERKIVPILVGSASKVMAIGSLVDAIVAYLPSPKERNRVTATNVLTQAEESLNPGENASLAALVFKTTADPYVGKLTYLRAYSGVLYSDSSVWNANKSRAERIGQLFMIRGKTQEPVPQIVAGDIGAVAKLAETTTGDTLCLKERPLTLRPITFPSPIYSVAVYPKTKADTDKLGHSLSRLAEEDPTLQIRRERDTAETIVSGMGTSHVEVAVDKMRRKFGVDVTIAAPKVPYKETIKIPVTAEYKHKKQTGGHGQYGHVFLNLEPLPRGSGSEFGEKVVGGSVPKNFIPAVEKGVTEALQEGALAGYPVVDVKVTLFDGSYHAVDSSEMSFKLAAIHAFKKGFAQAQPVLLEPIVNVKVTVSKELTGDIIGDLNSKRARVLGMYPQGGANVIEAQAPLAEMLHYAADLRSLTQGRGVHTMELSHYEEVPAHAAQKIIEAKKETQKA